MNLKLVRERKYNMPLSEDMLVVREYTGEGYLPLVDYGGWRIAVLRYTDELLPQKLRTMARHNLSDEVFVLLSGRCILFLGEGEDTVGAIYAHEMQPLKFYNVKQSCWHTHTLSKDATVMIVENRDTSFQNSPKIDLDPLQTEQITWMTLELWGKTP
jgi:hypothetical protein